MARWSAGLLPAPLNSAPGMKLLERSVNAPIAFYPLAAGETAAVVKDHRYRPYDPRRYGAVGGGVVNDAIGVDAAFTAAVAAQALLPFGGAVVMDWDGMVYATGMAHQLGFIGSGLTWQNAGLIAHSTFPGGFLVRTGGGTGTTTDGMKSRNLKLDRVIMDAKQRGGCLQLDRADKTKITASDFWGYSTFGIQTITDGHELLMDNVNMGQFRMGEGPATASSHTGTGIDLNTHDNLIQNTVIQLSAVGIRNARSFNQFTNIHVWTGYDAPPVGPSFQTKGIYCTTDGLYATFTGCYVDSCSVVLDNPWKTKFIGTQCLVNTDDPMFTFFKLKPLIANSFLNGLVIRDGSFVNEHPSATVVKSVALDTSAGGSFLTTEVKKNVFHGNSYLNASEINSDFMMAKSQTAATTWTFDFGPYFPIAVLQTVQFSVYQFGGAPQTFSISSIFSNTVTITASAACDATVYCTAGINIVPSV